MQLLINVDKQNKSTAAWPQGQKRLQQLMLTKSFFVPSMPCFACFFVPYSTFDNILSKLGIIVVGVALLKKLIVFNIWVGVYYSSKPNVVPAMFWSEMDNIMFPVSWEFKQAITSEWPNSL